MVFHGSEDGEYIDDVRRFASLLNVKYAFNSYSHPLFSEVSGDVYVPIYIGYGTDYLRTINNVGYSIPPMLEWPGFREFLVSQGPGLYVFHGNNDPTFMNEVMRLGIKDAAFLKVKPRIDEVLRRGCVGKVIPVVLTRGSIYRDIVNEATGICGNIVVGKPLLELDQFINYFRDVLPWVLKNIKRLTP